MPTQYTPQLGLSLPTQGELTGTWGDVTNTSMTSLVDTAIAGTTTLSTDVDVTLTATVGTANQARSAIILCNGVRTATRSVIAPASSKVYTVINATTSGFAIVFRGVGPTAGVTIQNGTAMQVAWNGTDFVATSAASVVGVTPIANGGTGQTTAAAALNALGGAPLASPVFTGNPQAPTPAAGDNDTSIATTAFVTNAVATGALSSSVGQVRETYIAVGGQTVFTLVTSYIVGGSRLNVYINGVRQYLGLAYAETNNLTVTFDTGLTAGDVVLFENLLATTGATGLATLISYTGTALLPSSSVQDALTTLSQRTTEPFVLFAQGVS